MPLTAARIWEGTFPGRCVSCGGLRETESTLAKQFIADEDYVAGLSGRLNSV